MGCLTSVRLTAVALAFVSACGESAIVVDGRVGDAASELPCFGLGVPYYCFGSLELAARDTTTLTVSTEDVLAYYRLLRPIYVQEPMLGYVRPHAGYSPSGSRFTVTSAHQPLIDAWTVGARESSDPAVTAVLADADPSLTVGPFEDDPKPGYVTFALDANSYHWISWRVVLERVAPIPDTIANGTSEPPNGMDIVHSTDGDEHVFDIDFGWGDCELGCVFTHHWIARVHQDFSASLVDLGGDDVTAFREAAATELPPLPEL